MPKAFRFFFLVLILAVVSSCVIQAPGPAGEPPPPAEPEPEPEPTPATPPRLETAAPTRFILNFRDCYLVYQPPSGTLQIAAEGNVLSYGGDWEVHKVYSYLYHVRLRTWRGFFWQVNTSRREVFRIEGGTFGSISGGSHTRLSFRVETVGHGGTAEPDRFLIYFTKPHLVYSPHDDVLQIIAQSTVISYGGDWQRCRVNNNNYDFRQNNWDNFFWKVNTINRRVWRCRGGVFCRPGGSNELLHISVSVTR